MTLIILVLLLILSVEFVVVILRLAAIQQDLTELKFPFLGSTTEDIDYFMRKATRAKKELKKGTP